MVDALEAARHDPGRVAEDRGRFTQERLRNVSDLLDSLRRIRSDDVPQLVESDGVLIDKCALQVPILDDQPNQPIEEGEIGSGPWPQMEVRLLRCRRRPRIDDDEPGRPRSAAAIEDPGPEHRLRLGHVVADHEDGVGRVVIGIGAGTAVGAERLDQRGRSGRGAEARIAIEVRSADAGARNLRQRIVLFEHHLTAAVESDRARPVFGANVFGAGDDFGQRFVPRGLDQPAVPADERPGQSIRGVIGNPTVQSFRPEPPAVDAIDHAAPDGDHAATLYADVERAAVRTQNACGLDPSLGFLDDVLVEPAGPFRVRVWRPLSPNIVDAVQHRPKKYAFAQRWCRG